MTPHFGNLCWQSSVVRDDVAVGAPLLAFDRRDSDDWIKIGALLLYFMCKSFEIEARSDSFATWLMVSSFLFSVILSPG